MNKNTMNRNIPNLLLAVIAFGSLLSLSAGGVETMEYCDTLTISDLGSEYNHTLPLFDPGLGNLVRVDLIADLEILQNFSLENEGNVSRTANVESESVLLITLPDETLISANASSSISEKLAAYDGETDFGGSSGKMIEGVESRGSAEEQYLKPSDFVASFQNETVSLPAEISTSSSTSGNIVFSLSTVAESKVCVTYTYEPSGSR
jgi:hypothetical protein